MTDISVSKNKEGNIELSPLAEAIQNLINEREELKVKIIELQTLNDKLALRERLYQSELGKTRTALQKLAQAIDTTPHTSAEEYQKYYERDVQCQEQ